MTIYCSHVQNAIMKDVNNTGPKAVLRLNILIQF